MISNSYYPKLSSFINLDALPEDLKFIENISQDLLKDIFVKEYQFNKSALGESGSFYLIQNVLNILKIQKNYKLLTKKTLLNFYRKLYFFGAISCFP